LRAARLLEPLAMLWIELALKRGQGHGFAFALTRRG
jgi:8-hydroxy-5-deazaflavin:NADPH oxidoreductase